MTDVARLDFAGPPPGYTWDGRRTGYLRDIYDDLVGSLLDAWTHYKARFDPPGIITTPDASRPGLDHRRHRGRCEWTINITVGGKQFCLTFNAADQPAARTAAWAWHDRRNILAKSLEDEGMQIPLWPALLVRTDDDCEACESWLKRGPAWAADDFPTVLKALARPCGPHCDCEAMGHG